MMNRMEVANAGKTAFERRKGKRDEVAGLEFAEKVMWKYHPGKKMETVNHRWGYGLFVGIRELGSQQVVCGDRQ
jgi:hypothetical protein